MTQLKHFGSGLLALGISLALQSGVAADTQPGFRIMSDQEVATHATTMSALQGEARDSYRNAQYEQLRLRALQNGYQMPASPPWAAQNSPAPTAAAATGSGGQADATPDAVADAAARHAAMREKLQARRDTLQQAADANLERLLEATKAQQQEVDTQIQANGPHAGAKGPGQDVPGTEPGAIEPTPPAVAESSGAPAAASPKIQTEPTVSAAEPAASAVEPAVSAAEPAASAAEPAVAATASESVPVAPKEEVSETPRFAPVEELNAAQAVTAARPTPMAPTAPTAPVAPLPPAAPSAPMAAPPGAYMAQQPRAAVDEGSPDANGAAYAGSDAMTAYRESMRARFDEYMKEREETIRRQREQHDATMEQNRAQASRNRFQPYPFPAMPAYGPRYPAAYPGYRTPYWQQPQPQPQTQQ